MKVVKARINEFECMLSYDERISPEKAPAGYPYVYHIRHDENNWTCPISIERFVFVNFFGTVFTKEPIRIDKDGYMEIERFELEHDYTVFRVDGALFEKMFGL